MLNRVYRLVWNHSRSAYMVASEAASSSGKKSSLVRSGRQRIRRDQVVTSMALVLATGAWALPQGGQVVAGQATIAQTPQSMTVTQSSSKAIINWSSFGIAGTESVDFVQPGTSSVILNRVIGQDPSQIYGHLTANGQVFLVNPNGILFAKGASVDVGGLAASTLNVSDSNFLAGKFSFTGNSQANVDNQGQIQTSDAGYVALLGAHVSNEGRITARLGSVALAAGQGITLDLANDGLLTLSVDQGTYQALVANGGIIEADGGQVLLTTQAAQSMLDTVVNDT
ncbi:MAG: filamentous hemagglutinin N-terminal domain-containing protein, partial [Pseudomonadales bacterium]|nr:filamentous hemagglutinin N-terminal domain-containing protein [Pseudomonadales bacterium]